MIKTKSLLKSEFVGFLAHKWSSHACRTYKTVNHWSNQTLGAI